VLFNCATIPQNLLESELFGYVKGAFTDAQETRKGIIEEAISGILFFDEISELPVNLQSKILRLIENKEYKKVGDSKIKKCSCRFIFATNKDIKKLILNNKFIPDLYYRISVICIKISPLRERKEDIIPLVKYFLDKENSKLNLNKKIDKLAINKLLSYQYPGNIRELENIIKRAIVISEDVIQNKHIVFDSFYNIPSNKNRYINKINELLSKGKSKTYIAKELGISRQWLYHLLKTYNYYL
ncbi:MAG: sigma 54-interacting transcriptional regulator, partial [Promethearchaeati archaeon]